MDELRGKSTAHDDVAAQPYLVLLRPPSATSKTGTCLLLLL
eukprot:COSAG01_NODE_53_length_31352_cov_23.122452_13_plen_41_part_00